LAFPSANGALPYQPGATKNGYPPDKQEKATLTVLEQAESICADVVETNT